MNHRYDRTVLFNSPNWSGLKISVINEIRKQKKLWDASFCSKESSHISKYLFKCASFLRWLWNTLSIDGMVNFKQNLTFSFFYKSMTSVIIYLFNSFVKQNAIQFSFLGSRTETAKSNSGRWNAVCTYLNKTVHFLFGYILLTLLCI